MELSNTESARVCRANEDGGTPKLASSLCSSAGPALPGAERTRQSAVAAVHETSLALTILLDSLCSVSLLARLATTGIRSVHPTFPRVHFAWSRPARLQLVMKRTRAAFSTAAAATYSRRYKPAAAAASYSSPAESRYFAAAAADENAMDESKDERTTAEQEEEAEEIEFADEDEEADAIKAAATAAQPTKRQRTNDSSKKAAAAFSSSDPAAAVAAASSSSSVTSPARASSSVLSFPDAVLSGPISAYSAAFDTIARDLLTKYELSSNGERLRLMECEMYWRGDERRDGTPSHHDVFAHGHPVQLNNYGRWYWHRQGQKPDAAFKAASYKGCDVTFGPVSGGGHGGILIRSVQRVSDGEIIEGSCNVAHEILRHHKVDSVVALHDLWNGNTDAFTNPTLFFALSPTPLSLPAGTPLMIRSPRVGLTLKQPGVTRPQYIMLPYRYTMLPLFNKKQKQTIILSAYEELGPQQKPELGKLLGMKPEALERFLVPYEAGKKLASMQPWLKDNKKTVNAEDMCKMYGAWMACHGAKPHVAIMRA
jgi:hypothetical protein